ncbi:MAG: hypothetical protein J5769_00850 [Bacteroidales bacterium]|nr:hypothetical protein [Bacteroidales bacterium]
MKWLHNLLKGISLTGALFVFQACYGSPADRPPVLYLTPMDISVVSHSTGEPLEGIRVLDCKSGLMYEELGVTDAGGKCRVELPYYMELRSPTIRFEDPSGSYTVKDTLIADLRVSEIKVKLDPEQ